MTKLYIPAGFQAITPFICVQDFQAFLAFVQQGLGATILEEISNDEGAVVYATIKLDDSTIRVQEAWDAESVTPAMLYFYVPDVEQAYKRAIEAGAEPFESGENPFGDQDAVIADKWGNFWWFAKKA
jgi:PhnB protein